MKKHRKRQERNEGEEMIKTARGQREEMEGGIKDAVKGWNGENAT